MDDPPAWAEPWPFWKFGLKQNDLNTTLHAKYNIISTPIQDSEAFHHDVYELSTKASTRGEFEQLMEERKVLRLKELNGMLEDASFEIIGNPQLIGNDQWGLAIQLFRTRSLDSLVGYFASYLPRDHPWHHDPASGAVSDAGQSSSPAEHVDYDGPILFDEPEVDSTAMNTYEHSENLSTCYTAVEHPTRSNSLRSLDSGVSVDDRRQAKSHNDAHFPLQTMSIVDFDSEHTPVELKHTANTLLNDTLLNDDNDAPSLLEDADSPSTSVSDITQTEEHIFPGAKDTEIVDEENMRGYLSMPHARLQGTDTLLCLFPIPISQRACELAVCRQIDHIRITLTILPNLHIIGISVSVSNICGGERQAQIGMGSWTRLIEAGQVDVVRSRLIKFAHGLEHVGGMSGCSIDFWNRIPNHEFVTLLEWDTIVGGA